MKKIALIALFLSIFTIQGSIVANAAYFDILVAASKTMSNNNLYQILTYVANQDPLKKGNVCGMLLYAQTNEEPSVSFSDNLNQHKIIVKTLNLNDDWEFIKNALNQIANKFKMPGGFGF